MFQSPYTQMTPGNVSKKWNKHLSFYFTLSGLPPQMTNAEYNIHFIGTSNTAGELEIADHIVDELNLLGTEGFKAFDHSIGHEVHVMVVVLCHLGDSPMHAEITNTPNPATALNPCCVCQLSVKAAADKMTPEYLQQFLGIRPDGSTVCVC
ncbi:hypothetical protein CROQUDRAFT_90939 [Cronartium quercuum f. sp. fusiforme G11]|uniref:Uncharacterized protein n=1 Tax=Cronartium quercuum f. sp. fusiforme G11 TaxID=708437 RepID=A0A9P6TDI8_9BASI|nr:hypothetical protein CROQUDRAFT_90939 [Cronartium quercuum f. sp. fusiforme G11]